MSKPRTHPWTLDGVRWGYELLPEEEKARLAYAIAIVDEAIAAKRPQRIDPELEGAVAQIAAVVARYRPRYL